MVIFVISAKLRFLVKRYILRRFCNLCYSIDVLPDRAKLCRGCALFINKCPWCEEGTLQEAKLSNSDKDFLDRILNVGVSNMRYIFGDVFLLRAFFCIKCGKSFD